MKLRDLYPETFELENTLLEEIQPKHFQFLVDILNNKKLMKYYRDMSVEVNLETQKKWYEKYLKKDQRYYIISDNKSNALIGTTGFTYFDAENMNVIGGWLLMDKNSQFYKPLHLIEFRKALISYSFDNGVENLFAYVHKKSDTIINLHKKFGYNITGIIKYPDYLSNINPGKVIEMKLSEEQFLNQYPSIKKLYTKLRSRG